MIGPGAGCPGSRSGGPSLEDRLRERDLEEFLQEQHAELLSVQFALAQAKRGGAGPMSPTTETPTSILQRFQATQATQCYAAEAQRIEEALLELQRRVPLEWLRGPATSIEHELARRRHVAEVQRLENALSEARMRCFQGDLVGWQQPATGIAAPPCSHVTEAWSRPPVSGPASPPYSHVAEAWSCLPAPGPFGSPSPELAAWPPPTQPRARPDPAMSWPRQVEIPPSEVIVERRRRFGDRVFRLWVEDCSLRGGVSVHAMDILSFCSSQVDLQDHDIQAMFNHFSQCNSRYNGSMSRWIAGETESTSNTHDHELREFLCCLLDAAYFELDETGSALQLRLPAFVEPELPIPSEEQTFIEVDRPQTPTSPVTARWIREKLLVPRSVAVEQGSAHRSRSLHGGSQCSQSRGPFMRNSHGTPTSVQMASPSPYAAPPRRSCSVPRAAAAVRGPDAALGLGGRAPSRPSSAQHAGLPISASIKSRDVRDPVAAAWSCNSSLAEASRYTNVAASASIPHDVCNAGQPMTVAAGRQTPPKHRPASARARGAAAGSAGMAVRARAVGSGQGGGGYPGRDKAPARIDSLAERSQHFESERSQHFESEYDQHPVGSPHPPRQPRAAGTRTGSGRPFQRRNVEPRAAKAATAGNSARALSPTANRRQGEATGTGGNVRQRLLRPTSAKATKHKRVADNNERPIVYEDCGDSEPEERDGRLRRPTSAKATKHKRVADNNEKPIVYEDCEDSEPEECECDGEKGAFEIKVPLREGGPAHPMQSLAGPPPKPMQIHTPPKPLVEAWHRPSPPAAKHVEQVQIAPGAASRLASTGTELDEGICAELDSGGCAELDSGGCNWPDREPGPVSSIGHPEKHIAGCATEEPRASSPPPRPRHLLA